jgi:hypothetical protein
MYRPGKQSAKLDTLSCQADHPDVPPTDQAMVPESVFANLLLILSEKEIQNHMEQSLDQDKSLAKVLEHF